MTFHINERGVNNTEGTDVTFGPGGEVKVGGNFHNSGKVRIMEGGKLKVSKDLVNTGDLSINDTDLKKALVDAINTSNTLAKLALRVLKILGLGG